MVLMGDVLIPIPVGIAHILSNRTFGSFFILVVVDKFRKHPKLESVINSRQYYQQVFTIAEIEKIRISYPI